MSCEHPAKSRVITGPMEFLAGKWRFTGSDKGITQHECTKCNKVWHEQVRGK